MHITSCQSTLGAFQLFWFCLAFLGVCTVDAPSLFMLVRYQSGSHVHFCCVGSFHLHLTVLIGVSWLGVSHVICLFYFFSVILGRGVRVF
jgi:hypothetical protein